VNLPAPFESASRQVHDNLWLKEPQAPSLIGELFSKKTAGSVIKALKRNVTAKAILEVPPAAIFINSAWVLASIYAYGTATWQIVVADILHAPHPTLPLNSNRWVFLGDIRYLKMNKIRAANPVPIRPASQVCSLHKTRDL